MKLRHYEALHTVNISVVQFFFIVHYLELMIFVFVHNFAVDCKLLYILHFNYYRLLPQKT